MSSDEQQSGALYELCALFLAAIRSLHTTIPLTVTDALSPAMRPRLLRALAFPGRFPPLSPAGVASMMLGMALTLMLCGSVTFMIGFVMMPWVLGLMIFLYVCGFVSSMSVLLNVMLGPACSRAPLKR